MHAGTKDYLTQSWRRQAVRNMNRREMMRGFPLQDESPGMNELFYDLRVEQEERKAAARFVNCETCQTEGRILTSDGGPDEIDNGVCPDCQGDRVVEVEVETKTSDFREECPSCKQMYENGGQCAAPVMRGGCPMGGDF
jgi:hypothetical protein